MFGFGAGRGDHNAGVVDEGVQSGVLREESGGRGGDGGEVGEVEVQEVEGSGGVGATGFDGGDGGLGFGLGTGGDVDGGVVEVEDVG